MTVPDAGLDLGHERLAYAVLGKAWRDACWITRPRRLTYMRPAERTTPVVHGYARKLLRLLPREVREAETARQFLSTDNERLQLWCALADVRASNVLRLCRPYAVYTAEFEYMVRAEVNWARRILPDGLLP